MALLKVRGEYKVLLTPQINFPYYASNSIPLFAALFT